MAVFCSVSLKMDATSPLRLSAAPPHPGQRLMHQDLLCQTVAPLQPRKTHPAATQHAFERVTTQELFHHLCIAHFRHWFRFIHPQSTVHLRQLLSTHPVGKEPEVPHHLKKLLRDVLFQPRDQLTLCQRFRRRFSRFVVQVTEAQAPPPL
ncbi:putative IS1294 ORF [Shigella flexneri 2b]|nr:putative IS1294 ORF [Shigella flexneri 2b]